MNWKNRLLLFGTAVGAIVGLGTALMLSRTIERDNPEGGMPDVSPGEMLGAVVAVIGVMRGINALGNGKTKKR